jgi:glycosyltransferase involved in cell wall biosynthesis
MRLLLLDQFSDPGGAQQCLLELLPAVRRRGWSAVVGMPGAGELFGCVRDFGFAARRIVCGPYRSGGKSLTDAARFAVQTPVLAAQIRRLATESNAQLVYVNGPRLLPAIALAGLRVPVVFHSHSYLFPGAVRSLAGMALKRCDAWVIGSCHFVAEVWQPFVPDARRTVIYNGVASPDVARPPRDSSLTVACVGRIAPEKGQREFVAAAAMIRRLLPACRFMVYGAALFADDQTRRYDSEVRAAGARAGVEFAGWSAQVHEALARTDLLLVPSAAHEATTRVILEAHAAGVPVIAFRSGGIPEVMEHGRDGWLADSTEEMARLAVELLTGDTEMRAAMARSGQEAWASRFTLERYHRELLDALEKLGREHQSPRI